MRRLSKLGLVALAVALLAGGAAAAKKKPAFFKIKSTVTIDSRGAPTATTYRFEGSTSAGGAGFELQKCRFGRLVRLHYVNALGDLVVGATFSVHPPDDPKSLEGFWTVTVPQPNMPTQAYAEIRKRRVKQGVCKPDASPRVTLSS